MLLNSIKYKVLIVDDEPFNTMLLSEVLKNNNYDLHTASSGSLALKIAHSIVPDIVLLDIMMPLMDGFEVCQYLKNDPMLKQIPIIFISSLNDSKNIVKALEVGGVDFITKPFQFEEVNARIKTHLTLHIQNQKIEALNNLLEKQSEHLKKFSTHLQNMREDERLAVANKVHDSIGQLLISMKIKLGLWKKNLKNELSPDAFDKVESKYGQLSDIIDQTIDSAREIVAQLKSDQLELLGLIETIELSCSEFQLLNNVSCSFTHNSTNIELNESQKIAIYRILQEALANITKHANCKQVTINLLQQGSTFSLEVKDYGVGFDTEQTHFDTHYGILGMMERAQFLNADLTIRSKPNEGTVIKLDFDNIEQI